MTNQHREIDWSNVVFDYEERLLSMPEIAAEYGCALSAVHRALHTRGAKIRPKGIGPRKKAAKAERNEAMFEEFMQGERLKAVAEKNGLTLDGAHRGMDKVREQRGIR